MKNWHAVDESFGAGVLYPVIFMYSIPKDMYRECTLYPIVSHIFFHSLSSLYYSQQSGKKKDIDIIILKKRKLRNRELDSHGQTAGMHKS